MIEIRRLTIEDLDGLSKLLAQLWIGKSIDASAVRKVIEKGLESDYQIYVCATDNGKLIGYCSLSIKNSLWMSANLGNVDELVVDSEYRNQGIGKMLMNEIEKIAKNHDCKRLELDSAFHRTKAHEFYEKLGFEKRAYLFTKELTITT
jgi:ribosomal protein S18 acetylase RimI-like enzyme